MFDRIDNERTAMINANYARTFTTVGSVSAPNLASLGGHTCFFIRHAVTAHWFKLIAKIRLREIAESKL